MAMLLQVLGLAALVVFITIVFGGGIGYALCAGAKDAPSILPAPNTEPGPPLNPLDALLDEWGDFVKWSQQLGVPLAQIRVGYELQLALVARFTAHRLVLLSTDVERLVRGEYWSSTVTIPLCGLPITVQIDRDLAPMAFAVDLAPSPADEDAIREKIVSLAVAKLRNGEL